MRPLAATMVFIIIAMIVGVFRQVIFNSSNTSGDDSNIGLNKLHTLTVTQPSENRFTYNSLYEALYKPQEKKELPVMLPYNSFVLKKSILNNEDVYICDQKYATIFEEKTQCDNQDSMCKWKTSITVYRLPYFKKEEEKVVEVEGRVLKSGGIGGDLECISKTNSSVSSRYELNFVILQRSKVSKKGSGWTMNSLSIQQQGTDNFNSTFNLKMMKWNLKNVQHYPKLYNLDEKCLSYVTEQEPWLIHFNCGKNWSQFNILNPKVQSLLFSRINSSSIQTPFSSTHFVSPLYLQVFKSTLKNYYKPHLCGNNCPKHDTKANRNFVTYVFEIVNSHYLLGSTVAQLTIAINHKSERKEMDGLVSFDILSNQINPEKKVNLDCNVKSKKFKLIEGLYNYQLGSQGQNHTVAEISKHSLICICSYNYKESLKIIQIEDLFENINMTSLNNPGQLLIVSQDDLEQSKVEHIVKKSSQEVQQVQEEEEDGWFDFLDISIYNFDEDQPDLDQIEVDNESDKKGKQKSKKEEKKKVKKSRVDRKEQRNATKIQNTISKLKEINTQFTRLGTKTAFQASTKVLQFPMPFTLTSDSQFKIISGDLSFPLVYIETSKKYLLTYQSREEEDAKNKTRKIIYSYKYSQIGTSVKSPENYIKLSNFNQSSKFVKKKDEFELDKFLLQVIQQNSDILNQVKSLVVVDARYEQNIKKYVELKGMKKPFRKQVIVVWGWGLEVYQVNWDKKGLKNQLPQLEELLNSHQQGLEMLTLLPFIQLFATVYCLFQTLVSR